MGNHTAQGGVHTAAERLPIAESDVTGLTAALALKANIADLKGWIWVDSVELLIAGPSLVLAGLDGNADGVYKFIGKVKAVTDGDVYFRPNGITTNQFAVGLLSRYGSGNSTLDNTPSLFINSMGTGTNAGMSFEYTFHATAVGGGFRSGRVVSTSNRVDAGLKDGTLMHHSWEDSGTNVTSGVFISAANFAIGSRIDCYKLLSGVA